MRTRTRTGLRILFLLAFSIITLGINFLHTESGPRGRGDCPACHFLTSSLSTNPAVIFLVPDLVCRGTLAPVESPAQHEAVVLSRSSRAPPSA